MESSAAGFVKRGPPEALKAEVEGLEALRQTGEVRVCRVLEDRSDHGELTLEFLAEDSRSASPSLWREFGARLARMHRHTGPAWGWEHDNWCGRGLQPAALETDWWTFYGHRRVLVLVDRAQSLNLLEDDDRHQAESLVSQLASRFAGSEGPPSLIHGDLWAGNVLWNRGEPVLIDPSVSWSCREAELAMCRLFGGFPDAFFDGYGEEWPLPPGWQERVELYQLYHLLNHLCIFGTAYRARCRTILRRWG